MWRTHNMPRAKRYHKGPWQVRVDLDLADYIVTFIGLLVRTSSFRKDRPAG